MALLDISPDRRTEEGDTMAMRYLQIRYWEEIIVLIVFAIAIVVTAILWVIAVYKEKKKRRRSGGKKHDAGRNCR